MDAKLNINFGMTLMIFPTLVLLRTKGLSASFFGNA